MHTLHTTIILNLRLKGFVTIWEFTLLFFHTSKTPLASIFAYAHIFSGLEKIILISLLQSSIAFNKLQTYIVICVQS
jgi:hypothetical protein